MVDAKLIALIGVMGACVAIGIGTYTKDAKGNAVILTDGIRWAHEGDGETGDICMKGGSFQSRTFRHDNIFVQDVVDGKIYSYQMQNADVLRDQVAAGPPADFGSEAFTETDWIDELEGAKYNCKVEDAPEAVSFAATSNGDGTYKVGGWDVVVDTFNNPTSLSNSEDDWALAITGVSSCADVVVAGCDPDGIEGSDSPPVSPSVRRRLAEFKSEQGSNILRGDATDGRGLGMMQDFSQWASNTKWCGAGSDITNLPCPSSEVSGDLTADRACRRHDHGEKAESIIGGMAVRLGCDIDHALASASNNWAVQGVFGSWGLAQTWGCYDTGRMNCWNWASKWWGGYWRYGGYCSGEHTHYGPWRYSSYSHRYGYRAKVKTCSGDIW